MEPVEVIVRRTGDVVEVLQGERTTGELCLGEVIEQVLGVIYGDRAGRKVYPMETPAEREARRAAWRAASAASEGKAA
jgi:hypothetical protein